MAAVEIIEANLINNKTTKKELKKACAYCRVSTDEEEQLTSYNSQIEYYSKMIRDNPELTLVGIYADEGITGTQMKKRNEFLRMIEDAKNGLIDLIIAKSISRFARNTVHTLETCRLLRELNVDVYFEKENIHTLYMDSEMFLTLYSAFAQAESESTSQNVKMGYRAKMKRGEPCGLIACYGFNWNKITKEMTINEEEAKVVRLIFDYYVSGIGTTRICRELESKGIKSPKGGYKWHPSVIKTMLTNVKYVGDIMGQKYYIENPLTHKQVKNRGEKTKYHVKDHHKPIIDREIWDKAQEIYNKRSKKMKDGKQYCEKYSIRYPYSSKIECGICHKNYVRRQGRSVYKGKKRYYKVYWKCSEYVTKTGDCDASRGVREDELNDMFVQLFNEISSCFSETGDETLLKKIEKAIYANKNQDELKKLEAEELKIRKKMSALIDLKLEDKLIAEIYDEKENELRHELQVITTKINDIKLLINSKQNTQERINKIKETLKNTKKLEEFNPQLFETLIEKIYIGEVREDSTKDYSVIRFVLKTGELANYHRDISKKDSKKIMSFEPNGRIL